VNGDIVETNAQLDVIIGSLAQNGGPTLTCVFTSTNPAFDAGDDTLVTGPLNLSTDQRGFARLSGPHVDIGAYEMQWPTTPILFSSSTTNETFFLKLTNVPGLAFRVLRSLTLSSNWGSPIGTMSPIAPGQYEWTSAVLTTQTQQLFPNTLAISYNSASSKRRTSFPWDTSRFGA
jgi:hypothetical protein